MVVRDASSLIVPVLSLYFAYSSLDDSDVRRIVSVLRRIDW